MLPAAELQDACSDGISHPCLVVAGGVECRTLPWSEQEELSSALTQLGQWDPPTRLVGDIV